MAALAYDPKHLTFVASGQSYMLVRHFKAPDRANLPHVGYAAARAAVEAAVKANPGLAQAFNKTFSHNVGKVHRFTDASTPVADAILQIQRKELHLLKLGPVAEIPKDVVAAAGGSVKTFKRFDFGDYARAGHAASPPIPGDPVERLILIVQGLADLKVDDVGAKMWEKVKGLTEGRVIAALTTAFTAFVMAQLTGPAALLLDSALLGYGLYSLGTGIFQFAEDLHDWWDRVTTARTREDLKKLSIALALILAVFAIERIVALLTRGGKKKGGGGKEDDSGKSPSAPADTKKLNPVPGKSNGHPPPPTTTPKTGSPKADAVYDKKIGKQMPKRGWTENSVEETMTNPHATSPASNKATGGPATAFFNRDGSYVVRDDATKAIIQVSNRNDPNWVPDPSITKPYKRK